MPLTKTKKEEVIREFTDRFKRKKIAIFSDFRGVPVIKSQALRRSLRQNQAEYKVAKKTLIDRALAEAGIEAKTKALQGEIGVAFGYEDEVSPAKTLLKFSKEMETFKILGGLLGNRFLSASEVIALAKLPSREIILAQLLGALSSPIRGLAMVLQGNIRNLVVVLSKIKESRS